MKAPKLKAGDTVAIISPSNTLARWLPAAEQARKNLAEQTGLNVIMAPNALAKHYYSAGTVRQRLDDFHWALRNSDVKAILFSAGGHTAIDLVEELDYDLIKENPKIIAGISDGCTLLDAIYTKTGLITYHGFELRDFAKQDMSYTVNSIKQNWFEDKPIEIIPNPNWKDFNGVATTYSGWQTIQPGQAEGIIIGGNLGCFTQLRGTEYFPSSFKDTIFIMETWRWSKRQLHRGLMNLKLWGILDEISGLIVGYCVGSDEPNMIGDDQSMKDMVLEVTDGYEFPIMWVGEIGHNVENAIWPIGGQVVMDATNRKLTIS